MLNPNGPPAPKPKKSPDETERYLMALKRRMGKQSGKANQNSPEVNKTADKVFSLMKKKV